MATVYENITEQDREEIKLVLATLKEVVDEVGPEYEYEVWRFDPLSTPTCQYVKNGQPDCIAARVLVKLGVPVYTLASYEGVAVNIMARVVRDKTGSFVLGEPAAGILRVAQQIQDRPDQDRTWGLALEWAQDKALQWYGVAA